MTKPPLRTKSALRVTIVFLLFATVLPFLNEAAVAQSYDVTLHVNGNASNASDSNVGSSASPLRTINAAVTRAIANKRASKSTRVLVYSATYRESINLRTYTNYPSNQPNNTKPILVEAQNLASKPVVSGADVWSNGWSQQGNLFVHNWTYNWGVTNAPWSNTIIDLTDIVLRREMVYLNNQRLTPVLSQSLLGPGKFFVNENTNQIFVYPPSNVNFGTATKEVAIRDDLWNQDYENNVTIRGIIFEKSTDPWLDAHSQVRIVGSNNITIEDSEFRFSNWTGLYVGIGTGLTIRRSKINDNGGRGMAMWREKNVLIEDSEARRNNWRGYLQGTIANQVPFTGWTTGGTNIESTHDVTARRFELSDNFTRGLWLDTDVVNGTFDDISVSDNENDGMFLEAVQGPITISNSSFTGNLRHGLLSGMAERVSIIDNTFDRNGTSPMRISGNNAGRGISNFETNAYQTVLTRYWTMTGNDFLGDGPYLIGTTVNNTRWSEFVGNLTSNNNNWCDETKTNVFQRDGGQMLNLAGWRSHTGEDANSTYCADAPPPPTGDDQNLALNASVSQSSTSYGGVATRGNDGVTSGGFSATTHTGHDQNAWWQADLGTDFPLTEIRVWNRDDCCSSRVSDFHVFVSSTPFVSTDLSATQSQSGVRDFAISGTAGRPTTITTGGSGRYVRIQLSGKNFLNMMEVEIFGGGSGGGNRAPTVTLSNRTNVVGNTVNYQIAAADPDGDALTYQASPLPSGLVLNANTGRITGTVTSQGTTSVNVAVSDGNAQATGSFVWTVNGGSSTPTNVALDATVSQSSVAYGGVPGRAIDDETNGRYFNSNSVTHTNSDTHAWWQADLGQVVAITEIVVWSRTDCCQSRLSNYHVLISATPFTSTDLATTIAQPGVTNIFRSGTASEQNTISLSANGRYVRVQLSGKNFLSLAEVQVMASGVQSSLNESALLVGLDEALPVEFGIDGVFPNPFSDRVTIRLAVPDRIRVRASVYDLTGREVAVLADHEVDAGTAELRWNGRTAAGEPVASGLYLIIIDAGNHRYTEKVFRAR